jgi:hypothetical protein
MPNLTYFGTKVPSSGSLSTTRIGRSNKYMLNISTIYVHTAQKNDTVVC